MSLSPGSSACCKARPLAGAPAAAMAFRRPNIAAPLCVSADPSEMFAETLGAPQMDAWM